MPDPTWTLSVDNDDTALDGTPNAPGDRWCVLWGPQGPCGPYVEGPAHQWWDIAEAIEQGITRRFKRVAFAPTPGGGGSLHSPRNSTGERDHVHLTRAELDGLVRSIRDQLAPAPGSRPPGVPTSAPVTPALAPTPPRAGAIPDDLAALLSELRETTAALPPAQMPPPGGVTIDADGVKRLRWRAAIEAVNNYRPAPAYRCLTCGDNGYVLGGVGNSFDEQAEDPCPDCGPGAKSAHPSPPAPVEAPAPVAVGLVAELVARLHEQDGNQDTPEDWVQYRHDTRELLAALARHRAPVEATREATGGAAKRYVVVTKDEAKPWDGHGGAWFDDDRNARSAADRMNRGIDRRDAVRWDLFYDRMPHHVAAIVDLWSSNGECTFTSRRPVRECLDCAAKEDGDE